jgi:hypothetical protein
MFPAVCLLGGWKLIFTVEPSLTLKHSASLVFGMVYFMAAIIPLPATLRNPTLWSIEEIASWLYLPALG